MRAATLRGLEATCLVLWREGRGRVEEVVLFALLLRCLSSRSWLLFFPQKEGLPHPGPLQKQWIKDPTARVARRKTEEDWGR
jgi:hypothetical protein